jgi:hypothetical protein
VLGRAAVEAEAQEVETMNTMETARGHRAGMSVARQELAALVKRDRMTDAGDVDRFDRRQRRVELSHLGRPGVRELRARLAAVRAKKAAVGGRALTEDEIDLAIETTGRHDDGDDRETGAGPAGGRGGGAIP